MSAWRAFLPRKLRALAVAAAALAASAPALAQRLGQGGGAEISIARVLAALLVCLFLAAGAAFALRKRLRASLPVSARPQRLRLIERLRLSHQVDVCLVACNEAEFIVAATPHGAAILRSGAAPGEAGPGE